MLGFWILGREKERNIHSLHIHMDIQSPRHHFYYALHVLISVLNVECEDNIRECNTNVILLDSSGVPCRKLFWLLFSPL